ncbi:MAG: hypothetical protein JWP32_966 [Schumannella sp.]|nr:hypothetical protein [Schumannella sp.]
MGVLNFIGSMIHPTDEQLASQYETIRLQYVATQDVNKSTRLYNVLHSMNAEMARRANKAYVRDNPIPPPTRHREHGWYLPNDD